MERPLILVTNDDGVTAPGIRALIEIAKGFGEVYVVAPDSPQSGMGHAVTINSTLFCDEIEVDEDVKEYACSGTPVDCVKLAVSQILPRKPDLCISGINHGSNSSVNVIYSGTMSAAVEAGIEGIPAIGFSLCDFAYNADFKAGEEFIKTMRFINSNFGNEMFSKYKTDPNDARKLILQSKFNIAVYDSFAIAIHDALKEGINILDKKKDLLKLFFENEFYESISGSYLDTNKLKYRIEKAKKTLGCQEILS